MINKTGLVVVVDGGVVGVVVGVVVSSPPPLCSSRKSVEFRGSHVMWHVIYPDPTTTAIYTWWPITCCYLYIYHARNVYLHVCLYHHSKDSSKDQ